MHIDLGGVAVDVLRDGTFRLDGGAMFGVVPRALWERLELPRRLILFSPLVLASINRPNLAAIYLLSLFRILTAAASMTCKFSSTVVGSSTS